MDGYLYIGADLDTSDFDAEIRYIKSQMQEIEDKLKQADMGFEVGDTQKLEAQYSRLNKQLSKMIMKQQSMNNTDLSKLQNSIDKVGNSVSKTVTKVGKWALAVFGVRSAYLFVRQAMGTLSQYDEQMATNVEWISYLLASMLKPIIETIINLAYKLLAYINYIAQAWFGVNLFANASAKAFEKVHNNVKKAGKRAKELQKTLAGFDEMNVLQENGDTNSGGGGGGVSLPSFPKMEDVPIPGWVEWIAKNKDIVIGALLGIAGALVALKMGATALQALGIGLAIAGIVYSVMALLDYLKDPSWENFGKLIQGIGIAIVGVGIAIGSVPAIVIGAIVLIVGTIIKYWDQIKSFLQSGIDWLTDKSDWVHKTFGDTIGNIYDFFVGKLKSGLDWLDLVFKSLKGILDGVIKFVKGVFTGNWKMAWEGVKQIFNNVFNAVWGTVKLVFNNIVNTVKVIAVTIGNVVKGIITGAINGILSMVEGIMNAPIRAINGLIGVINKIPGINLGRLSTFNLPRLAKGGIINMPGKGVPLGTAIGGERGAEAV